jgi:hypothetical protein
MSRSVSNAQRPRVQKLCTLWTHDDNFSRDDIVFNGDKFPEIPTVPGTLLQIVGIESGTAVRDFQSSTNGAQPHAPQAKGGDNARDNGVSGVPKRTRRGSITITIDENGSTLPPGHDLDEEKAYVFSVTSLPADLKSKHANLQVSFARTQCARQLTSYVGVDLREDCKSIWVPQPDAGYGSRGTFLTSRIRTLWLTASGR